MGVDEEGMRGYASEEDENMLQFQMIEKL